MVENEVKIYDSKIDLHSVNAENINPILSMPLKKIELNAHLEQSSGNQIIRFARKRKVKRTKSSGIF